MDLLEHLEHPARARRRRLDGRDDRPDDGRPAPGPGAQPRLDHVQHGPPLARHARPARLPDLPAPPARATSPRRSTASSPPSGRSARPASPSTRTSSATSPSAPTSAATTPPAPAASSPRSSPPATGPPRSPRSPRRRSSSTAPRDVMVTPSGGKATAARHRGRPARADRGHGPRPPARPLGPDHRPRRGEHRPRADPARGGVSTTVTRAGPEALDRLRDPLARPPSPPSGGRRPRARPLRRRRRLLDRPPRALRRLLPPGRLRRARRARRRAARLRDGRDHARGGDADARHLADGRPHRRGRDARASHPRPAARASAPRCSTGSTRSSRRRASTTS